MRPGLSGVRDGHKLSVSMERSTRPLRVNSPASDHLLYWSTVAYARWWLGEDASLCGLVAANKNRLNPSIMAAIALPYNVARGLPGKPKKHAREQIVALLNKRSSDWPDRLVERAEFCKSIAAELVSKGYVKNHQVSAVSKMMWFLKPQNWTMFDSYAADGMEIPRSPTGPVRMTSFYEKLDALGFEAVNNGLCEIVAKSPWSSIPAVRVLDTFLMRRGGMVGGSNSVDALDAFLLSLPATSKASLHKLAIEIQSEFGNQILT